MLLHVQLTLMGRSATNCNPTSQYHNVNRKKLQIQNDQEINGMVALSIKHKLSLWFWRKLNSVKINLKSNMAPLGPKWLTASFDIHNASAVTPYHIYTAGLKILHFNRIQSSNICSATQVNINWPYHWWGRRFIDINWGSGLWSLSNNMLKAEKKIPLNERYVLIWKCLSTQVSLENCMRIYWEYIIH